MSNINPLFSGSITALITPMNKDGSVDFKALESLVEYHIKAGTDAIVSVGTTGESATLSIEENVEVIVKTVGFAKGRIPIIAGTGANNTAEAIHMNKLVEDSGVVGCLSVVPYYNKPTQEGMYLHFKAIAEATKLPVILYNVPGRTGSDMKPETVARLAKIDNIVAIKEATGDLSRISVIKNLTYPDFAILSGDDATGLDAIKLGANGVISVTNNIVAADMANMCKLALAGNFDEAYKINNRLMALHHDLFCEGNPIPVKWAALKLGLIPNATLRLPMTDLTMSGQEKVTKALTQAQLL